MTVPFPYQRASELAPKWASPLNNLGICFERTNLREKAYGCYAAAAECAPKDQHIVRNAEFTAFRLKEQKYRLLAAGHLTSLAEHYPQDAGIQAKLAYVYYYSGEHAKARECARSEGCIQLAHRVRDAGAG